MLLTVTIKKSKQNQSLFYMNAVSEVISNHRKLVSEFACLLWQLRVDCSRKLHHQSYFVIVRGKGTASFPTESRKLSSDHITLPNEFRRQIIECKAVYGVIDHLSL